jgi:hypothetical protein
MKALKIMAPAPILSVAAVQFAGNVAALATPDPREACFFAAGAASVIDFDLGEPRILDTFFLGYNSFTYQRIEAIYAGNAPQGSNPGVYVGPSPPDRALNLSGVVQSKGRQHGLVQLAAPIIARYVRLQISDPGTNLVRLGVFACGASFTARWGHEWGAGRALSDTSSVDRLFGGGFGVDQGAIASGYQWTFGDLSNAEREALFSVVKSVGIGRPILVIEDPDFSFGSLIAQSNIAVNGVGQAEKGGPVDGAFDAIARIDPSPGYQILSWKLERNTGPQQVGFSENPASANNSTGMIYGVNYNTVGISMTSSGANLGQPPGNGTRFSMVYDEARFLLYRDGVLANVENAPPGLILGAKIALARTGDKISEISLVNGDYAERVHWGLLQKLEPYERLDPQNTKWSLQIGDWL